MDHNSEVLGSIPAATKFHGEEILFEFEWLWVQPILFHETQLF